MSSTASALLNTIFGGSFFNASTLCCSRSAVARLAVRRASEMSKPAVGIAVSTALVKRCSSASLESGQRTWVTLRSRTRAVPAARSVSTRAVNQNAPKIGSLRFFTWSAIAARPVSTLPFSVSGCGW